MSAAFLLLLIPGAVAPPEATRRSDRPFTDAIRFAEIELDTGVRLRYAEQGDSTGDPLILLHGYSDSWFSFSRILPLLPAGQRVFALDLRGHGGSEKPAEGYALRDLAADVIAFMEAKNLQGVTVAGHSLGSFVAQRVAVGAPDRVDRLVLINSTTTPRNIVGIRDLEATVRALTDPVSVDFIREFQASSVHHPVPPEFMDAVVTESRKLPARVWHAIMDGLVEAGTVEALRGNPIPTLIFWGDRDLAFPKQEQEALRAMLPNSTLEVYAETGHTPHWERPVEFARDLIAWIGKPARLSARS